MKKGGDMSGMYMGQKAICNNKMHIPAILCLFFTAFASISTNCQVVSEDEETKCTKCRSKLELFLYMLDQENICCIGMPCYMVALLCNFGDVPINLRPLQFFAEKSMVVPFVTCLFCSPASGSADNGKLFLVHAKTCLDLDDAQVCAVPN